MPGNSKHPWRLRFVVYALVVDGVPFYLGIGESEKDRLWCERAEDRVRFVEYLMRRELLDKPVNWCMSNSVVAEFIKLGYRPAVRYLAFGMTRKAALTAEREKIKWYGSRGFALANRHYNPNLPESSGAVVQAVLKKRKK